MRLVESRQALPGDHAASLDGSQSFGKISRECRTVVGKIGRQRDPPELAGGHRLVELGHVFLRSHRKQEYVGTGQCDETLLDYGRRQQQSRRGRRQRVDAAGEHGTCRSETIKARQAARIRSAQ